MRYTFGRAVAAVGVVSLVVACSDTPAPAPDLTRVGPPSFAQQLPGCDAAALYSLADQLSPAPNGGRRFELRGQITHVLARARTNQDAGQEAARALASKVLSREVVSLLRAPTSPALSREDGVEALVTALFACTGLAAPDFSDLPPNWSRLLFGGAALIGPEGGDLITPDEGAGIRVPAGAVDQTHLFAILPRWTATTVGQPACFNDETFTREIVGQCYDLVVQPVTSFNVPVRLVICAEPAVHAQHDFLHVAKQHDEDPVVVYPKLSDPFNLDCEGEVVLPKSLYEQLNIGIDGSIGSAARALRSLMSVAVSPFVPRKAYAADGVGSDIMEFSTAAAVYVPPAFTHDGPPLVIDGSPGKKGR